MAALAVAALAAWVFGRDVVDATAVAVSVVAAMVVCRIVSWDDVLGHKAAWLTRSAAVRLSGLAVGAIVGQALRQGEPPRREEGAHSVLAQTAAEFLPQRHHPSGQVAAYEKMAQWGKRVWMKHGAIGYYECLGDDLKGMPGCGTFTKLAKVKPGETVFFSFIIYKSKVHRNAVNKRVMAEMKNSTMPPDMPFVPGRLAFGGFRTIVQG